jgi:hypothetical protein
VADLEAAHKAGQPAVVMDIEGLDFLRVKFEKPPGRRTSAASGMLSFALVRRMTLAIFRPAR